MRKGFGAMLAAIAGVLLLIANFAALALHVFTVVLAYNVGGLGSAILTFCIPGLAEVYWFIEGWIKNSTPFSDYGVWCIAEVLIYTVSFGLILAIGALQPKPKLSSEAIATAVEDAFGKPPNW